MYPYFYSRKIISKHLDHPDIDMTIGTYSHMISKGKNYAINILNQLK